MPEGDSEFRIRASIDPSGADAGASQVQGDLDQIKGATGDAADAAEEGGRKFDDATLENRRNLTHLAHGLLELKEGGANAFAGLATEAYLAGEAMDVAMGPVGIALLGISILIPILTRAWGDHKGAVDDNKEAAEHLKDAFDAAIKSIDAAAKTSDAAISAQLEQQKAVMEGFKDAAKLEDEPITAAGELEEATKKVTLATLNLNYEKERGAAIAAGYSKDELDAMDRAYQLKVDEINAQDETDKNKREQQIAQIALTEKQKELEAQKADNIKNTATLSDLSGAATSTARTAHLGGFPVNDEGLKDSQAALAAAQAENAKYGGDFWAGQVQDAIVQVGDMKKALAAQKELDDQKKKLTDDIASGIQKANDLASEIDAAEKHLQSVAILGAVPAINEAAKQQVASNEQLQSNLTAGAASDKDAKNQQIQSEEGQESANDAQIKALRDQLTKAHHETAKGHELIGAVADHTMQMQAAQTESNNIIQTKIAALQQQNADLKASIERLKHP